MIGALHHLALRTRDVAGLAAFYRGALGLEVAREQPGYSLWLRLSETAVLMIEGAEEGEPGVAPGTRELTCFAVSAEEREALRARLRAMGVALDGETDFTTYFRDPDGRRVAVSTYDLRPPTGERQTPASDPEGG